MGKAKTLTSINVSYLSLGSLGSQSRRQTGAGSVGGWPIGGRRGGAPVAMSVPGIRAAARHAPHTPPADSFRVISAV